MRFCFQHSKIDNNMVRGHTESGTKILQMAVITWDTRSAVFTLEPMGYFLSEKHLHKANQEILFIIIILNVLSITCTMQKLQW